MQRGNEDYLPRRLQPHPPPPKSASSVTYDPIANQYVYVWKTDKAFAGTCCTLQLKLIDGTVHYADFKFTK